MLEQTETMGRSGSAEIDLDQGKAVAVQGLYTLLGLPFHPKAVPSWRLLQRLPAKERGYAASIWQGALPDEPFEFQHRLVCSDGKRRSAAAGMVETDGSGRRHGYVIIQDITAQREAEQRIQELANHDEVTGLANRTQLLDRIDAAVHAAKWDPQPFCCSPSRSIRWTSSSRPWAYGRVMPWPWPWHHAFARWPSPATSWRAWTAVNLQFC